ncbi:hypothetical protein [Lysinibacillus xylanilyticus]|uniref:Uncharacterized protein n=1 Tax=Lysinibacillus xylanilyticus TaxID=582475 RepID=A0ABT4EMR7_9BACI|nr:hypothetical protein [Lysinibacillus xylanilyticus]MCY9546818.1 hypothetical protein [Lysinibacillus xylanilyticus]
MVLFYAECEDISQVNITRFNNSAYISQTYFDYHGCLPKYEDDADNIDFLKVIKLM